MSESCAFTTEFLYCAECLEACNSVLRDSASHLCIGEGLEGPGRPIVAGMIHSGYARQQLEMFEHELIPEIQKRMCAGHTIAIAVLGDSGTHEVFEFDKDGLRTLIRRAESEAPG